MSNTIYSIKYDSNSFFSSNQNVQITFPFDVNDVVTWGKQTSLNPYLPSDYKTDNLFEKQLSNVIISNKDKFINVFLVGNAYFNSDFSGITVSTVIETPETPESQQPPITVNGQSYRANSIKSRNGSTSYVVGNPGFQRVNFQPTCTLNHLHFPGQDGCGIQEIAGKNGNYFKCVCTGTPVFDSTPHAHCSEFTNNIKNPQTAYRTAYSNGAAISSMMKRTQSFDISSNINSQNKIDDVEYTNADSLKDLNLLIRVTIYNYYYSINENIQYKNAIETRQKLIDTQNNALMDSTVKYKKEYLTAFNLLSGIIIAGGYIYGINNA